MKEFKEPVSLTPEAQNSLSPVDYKPGARVHLPDVSELECLPASGKIIFRFAREDLHVRGGRISADLSLLQILGIECDEEADEEADEEPLSDAVDKLFEEASKEESEKKDEG